MSTIFSPAQTPSTPLDVLGPVVSRPITKEKKTPVDVNANLANAQAANTGITNTGNSEGQGILTHHALTISYILAIIATAISFTLSIMGYFFPVQTWIDRIIASIACGAFVLIASLIVSMTKRTYDKMK